MFIGSESSATIPGVFVTTNDQEVSFVPGESSTLTTAVGCKDGIPVGVDIEWIHIHDGSSAMKDMDNERSNALKSVIDSVYEKLLSNNTLDRLTFLLVDAHHKFVQHSVLIVRVMMFVLWSELI